MIKIYNYVGNTEFLEKLDELKIPVLMNLDNNSLEVRRAKVAYLGILGDKLNRDGNKVELVGCYLLNGAYTYNKMHPCEEEKYICRAEKIIDIDYAINSVYKSQQAKIDELLEIMTDIASWLYSTELDEQKDKELLNGNEEFISKLDALSFRIKSPEFANDSMEVRRAKSSVLASIASHDTEKCKFDWSHLILISSYLAYGIRALNEPEYSLHNLLFLCQVSKIIDIEPNIWKVYEDHTAEIDYLIDMMVERLELMFNGPNCTADIIEMSKAKKNCVMVN